MPRTVLLILVFLPTLVIAQSSQPTDSSTSNQTNAQPQPTPTPNPQDQSGQNQRIQSSIDDLLSSDPVLSGTDVNVAVDDQNINLTGHVDSYAQHQRVLQLVSSYGRWRKIVDQVKMK
ncbi:MAG TPA: BON domain-containing protein [Candidatus Angelobacter sp.]|nr:BON domain-containing protein [Candidatus Angelobacter sp.]